MKIFLSTLFVCIIVIIPMFMIEAASFDSSKVFPGWKEVEGGVSGVLGKNSVGGDTKATLLDRKNETAWLLAYIPQVINILMKFIAPLVAVMLIYSGIKMISAGDDEEEVNKAKSFFGFAIWGIIVIAISFSFMKAIYFVLL